MGCSWAGFSKARPLQQQCYQFSCRWFIRQLSAVPYSYDPHGLVLQSIEKPVWFHDHFTKGEVREFRENPSGIGKLLETRQFLFCFLAEVCSSRRIVSMNVGNSFEKLTTASWGEENFQDFAASRKRSASFNTSPSSWPIPASISFSPRASKRKTSSSRCESS